MLLLNQSFEKILLVSICLSIHSLPYILIRVAGGACPSYHWAGSWQKPGQVANVTQGGVLTINNFICGSASLSALFPILNVVFSGESD